MSDTLEDSDYNWHIEFDPPEEQILALRHQLRQDNFRKVGPDIDGIGMSIMVRSNSDELLAGISGYLWSKVFEIDYLWVHETLRGQGVGSKLVLDMEEEAKERGCRTITANMFSFQASEFYRKLGYVAFGVIDGYGDRFQKYFLSKDL
jgi:GNAT superfamily N-acetyltransferase